MPFHTSICIFIKVGLGAGAPAIGIPFFWPSSAMPNTVMPEWSEMVFLKFNGATFSAATYPRLALVWPGLVLTESRGEFIRIADDGRGVDSGRALLSAQSHALQNFTGTMTVRPGISASGAGVSMVGGANGALSLNPLSSGNYIPVQATGSTGFAADVVTLNGFVE